MAQVVNVFMHHLKCVLCLFVALCRSILEQLVEVVAIVSRRQWQLSYAYVYAYTQPTLIYPAYPHRP